MFLLLLFGVVCLFVYLLLVFDVVVAWTAYRDIGVREGYGCGWSLRSVGLA